MNIIIANHTPIAGSGSGTYSAMIAQSLQREGNRVCLITPKQSEMPSFDGIQEYPVSLPIPVFPSFTGHPLSHLTYDAVDSATLMDIIRAWQWTFRNVAAIFKPDVIHIQHLWIVARAAIMAGLHPVVTCHGSEIKFAAKYPQIASECVPFSKSVVRVISISEYVKRELLRSGFSICDSVVLHNPYDDTSFRPAPHSISAKKTLNIGFAGRLVAYKYCEELLQCIPIICRRYPQLRVSIIGDGPERANLIRMAIELNIQKNVNFLGFIDFEKMPAIYRNLDVLVVPSRNEPFGLVALEASGSGVPVIVARSGGLEELIYPPYINGYEPGNIAQLCDTIYSILANPFSNDLRQRAGKYISSRFSLQSHIQKLTRLYEQPQFAAWI